jgi:hypothetical protein
MNKKIIIISVIVLIVLLLLIALLSLSRDSKENIPANTNSAPTITTVPIEVTEAPKGTTQPTPAVVSSVPANGQQNVAISTKTLALQLRGITVQKSEDVTIRIDPPTQFSYRAKDGKVQVTFLNELQQGITYSYSVSVKEGTPYIASFKTAGIGPTAKPGIEPPGFFEEQLAQQKATNPDIYLSNMVPYTSGTFKIDSTFVEKPTEYFQFTVSKVGQSSDTRVKADVKKWILDQGITGSQFSLLDIVYK